MNSLKNIKINNFGHRPSHYADLTILCSKSNDYIEKLDLSNSFCTVDIISILKIKNYPLKELKLKLYDNENEDNWKFLEYWTNNIELFELEIKEKINHNNMEKILFILNKMPKIKHLKLLGALSSKEIFNL